MKDWVIPYLKEETTRSLKDEGYDSVQIEEVLALRYDNLEPEEGFWQRLVDNLNTHFWMGAWGWAQDVFTDVFGSLLGDLPKEVYIKIRQMKNLFFVFNPSFGAEVKIFHLENDLKSGTELRIVVFPYSDYVMNQKDVLRGGIVHELVHVFEEHKYGPNDEDIEDKTDEIAKSWGFEKEIKAMRKYEQEMTDKKRTPSC
jgi:hypothetical protein